MQRALDWPIIEVDDTVQVLGFGPVMATRLIIPRRVVDAARSR